MARSKLASYKGPNYNSSSLVSAKTYYENFKERYPKDAEKLDVDTILKQIDEQLGYKQLSIGRYYQRTGSKQSANFYYQMVIDNWPKSKAALTARDLISGKDIQGKKVKK
jgi:outer membrane protein assembly factor BamD (BamD/ComL family)